MQVPHSLRQYACEGHFASGWLREGCWDEESQTMLLVPVSDIKEHSDKAFLEVGRAGVDGFIFGYRAHLPGVWAYYPIDEEFVLKADSLAELVSGWLAGDITV